jgi:hypothetical protein
MGSHSRSRPSVRVLALATVIAFWVAGCGSDLGGLPTTLNLENQTGIPITVIWVRKNAKPVNHGRIANGEALQVNMNQFGNPKDVCLDGQLVAYDDRGTVLLKSGAPCGPWVIRLPGQEASPAPLRERPSGRSQTYLAEGWRTAPAGALERAGRGARAGQNQCIGSTQTAAPMAVATTGPRMRGTPITTQRSSNPYQTDMNQSGPAMRRFMALWSSATAFDARETLVPGHP